MTKNKLDEKIAAPKPGKAKGNPHRAALRDLLLAENLTFEGARKGRDVGADKGTILLTAGQYWKEHRNLPQNAVVTWAFSTFWEIKRERSGG